MLRITDRLAVNFDTNEVFVMDDNDSSAVKKVEPRVMQVLEILVKRSPEVVTREELISMVWDNYGGADDALNQAISHIRRILNDSDKNNRIIQTVVKKGYRYVGELETTVFNQSNSTVETSGTSSRKMVWAIAIVAMLGILYLLGISFFQNEPARAPEAPIEQVPESNETAAPAARDQ